MLQVPTTSCAHSCPKKLQPLPHHQLGPSSRRGSFLRVAGNVIRDSSVLMKALFLIPQNIIMTHACACVSVRGSPGPGP